MTQTRKTSRKASLRPLFLRESPVFGRKFSKIPAAVTIHGENFAQKKFTGKELDNETGLYYFGARYLDPKTGRWLSGDPAVGEYVPSAPLDDEAKKRNQNLPGMGGVFNVVNLHVYHYAGNNPVKYIDPDGRLTIREILFGIKHPSIAYRIGIVKHKSNNISTTSVRFQWEMPLENTQTNGSSGNAFRHALWQATITSEFGSDIAETVGDAHESRNMTSNGTIKISPLTSRKADATADYLNGKAE